MDKEQDLLEELRLRAAALVEAKEKADDKEDEEDMEDEEDEIEDGDEGSSDDDSDEKDDKKSCKDKNESEEVDMRIESLFEGQDLSEEFKIKITALFEATVAQKVSAIEESYAAAMEEFKAEVSQTTLSESEENFEGLVERVDGYLDYMVEQWIENNEIAIERGIKADLFESFMHGMKGLFEEHMITVPEDKIEVLESQATEIEELESTVDSVLAENVELKQVLKGIAKHNQIVEAAEGLSDAEAERFVELAEDLAFESEDVFGKKLAVIREQFFTKTEETKTLAESVVSAEPLVEEVQPVKVVTESVDPGIAALAARLTRQSM